MQPVTHNYCDERAYRCVCYSAPAEANDLKQSLLSLSQVEHSFSTQSEKVAMCAFSVSS